MIATFFFKENNLRSSYTEFVSVKMLKLSMKYSTYIVYYNDNDSKLSYIELCFIMQLTGM